MTPCAYVETIVIPTLREALADRGDRRRCYLACIAVLHVFDYLAGGSRRTTDTLRERVRDLCGPAMKIVEGLANGTKHAGGAGGRWIQPGSDRAVRPFGFGPGCDGFDEGRWEFPGLEVENAGAKLFVDMCAQVVLLTQCSVFEDKLGEVDLSFLDFDVLRGPPEPWNSYWIETSTAEHWTRGIGGKRY